MFYKPFNPGDFKILSVAVQTWYRHFGVQTCDRDTERLCNAAIALFIDGRTTSEEVAAGLLEMFPTPDLLKINAPTSASVH